jgi:cyclase
MHTKRIIPCLDVRNGKVVKGINFVGIKEVGNPVELGEYYYKQGADEIVFLDIKIKTENNPQKNKLIRLIMISPKVAE